VVQRTSSKSGPIQVEEQLRRSSSSLRRVRPSVFPPRSRSFFIPESSLVPGSQFHHENLDVRTHPSPHPVVLASSANPASWLTSSLVRTRATSFERRTQRTLEHSADERSVPYSCLLNLEQELSLLGLQGEGRAEKGRRGSWTSRAELRFGRLQRLKRE